MTDQMEMTSTGINDVIASRVQHFGRKGMRWGVRRSQKELDSAPVETGPRPVSVKGRPGEKVSASGGNGQLADPDAVRTAASRQQAKVSTTDSLSTKQLSELVTRMNLEQQYAKLTYEEPKVSAGKKFINDVVMPLAKNKAVQTLVIGGIAAKADPKTAKSLNTISAIMNAQPGKKKK